jgi:hypothetical protein
MKRPDSPPAVLHDANLLHDGRLLAPGARDYVKSFYRRGSLTRLTAGGALDNTFGNGGPTRIDDVLGASPRHAATFTLEAGGKILYAQMQTQGRPCAPAQ